MPSKSKKQKRFMAAAAHNPKFAKKAGIKPAVAKEFNDADTRRGRKGYARGGLAQAVRAAVQGARSGRGVSGSGSGSQRLPQPVGRPQAVPRGGIGPGIPNGLLAGARASTEGARTALMGLRGSGPIRRAAGWSSRGLRQSGARDLRRV